MVYGRVEVQMAKKFVPAAEVADEEMSVVVLKFKGSGETLRRGMDAVTQALAALGGQSVVRAVSTRRAAQQISDGAEAPDIDAVHNEDAGDQPDPAPEASSSAGPRVSRKPTPQKGSFLPDFNTSPDGVPSLREFCAGKDGDTETNRYLLVTHWLSKHGGADPFNADQVFTAFRDLSPWKGRLDILQPIREMSSKKSFYTSPGRGLWKISAIGIKAAEAIGNKG